MFARCLIVAAVFLSACATTPAPEAIRNPPPGDPSLPEVRSNVDAYLGQRVRWGGTLVAAENRENDTRLDIVARPLESSGRPRSGDTGLGRFLARVEGFLDPAVWREGREVTVSGTVEGTLTRPIGEYPYRYIVVDVDTTQLWEPIAYAPYGYYPQYPYYPYRGPFYDPFYDPLWPGRAWPWYAPYPFYPYWR